MLSGYVLAAIAVASFGLVTLWWLWRRSARSMPLTILDVILVWPVVFAAARGSRPAARLSAQIIGGLVLLVVAAGIYLVVVD